MTMFSYVYILYLVVLVTSWTGSTIWAIRDAHARGSSRILVGFLVGLGLWPIGLFLWLSFRPYKSGRAGRRPRPLWLVLAILFTFNFTLNKYMRGNTIVPEIQKLNREIESREDWLEEIRTTTEVKVPQDWIYRAESEVKSSKEKKEIFLKENGVRYPNLLEAVSKIPNVSQKLWVFLRDSTQSEATKLDQEIAKLEILVNELSRNPEKTGPYLEAAREQLDLAKQRRNDYR